MDTKFHVKGNESYMTCVSCRLRSSIGNGPLKALSIKSLQRIAALDMAQEPRQWFAYANSLQNGHLSMFHLTRTRPANLEGKLWLRAQTRKSKWIYNSQVIKMGTFPDRNPMHYLLDIINLDSSCKFLFWHKLIKINCTAAKRPTVANLIFTNSRRWILPWSALIWIGQVNQNRDKVLKRQQ
jgi:hypothetical protein